MTAALIGFSGFVGSTLLRQTRFDGLYRANTIHQIDGQTFDLVVCAGAPAQKWIANRDPEVDRSHIETLIQHLDTLSCQHFVLISTVDVFRNSQGVNEDSPVDEDGLHPYGLHRRQLEKFVQSRFAHSTIVRLPGLVGPGLRKNVVFDLLNHKDLGTVDSRSTFQFYPMVNLWADLRIALATRLPLIHLTAAPVSVAQVAEEGFGQPFDQTPTASPVAYDMQSRHGALFGGSGPYQYSARESLLAIRAYAQSEPVTIQPSVDPGP